VHDERVLPPHEVLQNIHSPCIFVGSGALLYRGLIIDTLGNLAGFASEDRHIIKATTVAHLGLERFEKGDAGEVADLVPCYIRKSDAELSFSRKAAETQRNMKKRH
jgi:tRNA threonylcarbamoyladenosine biosynthesis protein TsaB